MIFGLRGVDGISLVTLIGILGPLAGSVQSDTHIYAGAKGIQVGDPLAFTVAALFDTNSGYKLPLVFRTNGLNAGFYRGDTVTFTVLAATDLGTGQLSGRALLGSRLAVELVQVDGPAGGAVQFWEGDGENPGDRVTYDLPVGTTRGSQRFIISENDGSPGSDPYGHIHGREFTTSQPGLYTVGFRLVDTSTNGPGGGPLHAPSDILSVYFQAGPTIESIQTATNGARVSFRSAPGVTNVLEAASSLTAPDWQPVSGRLRGNSALQSLLDATAVVPGEPRFYRLHLLHIPP
jgi:hypothetical protein